MAPSGESPVSVSPGFLARHSDRFVAGQGPCRGTAGSLLSRAVGLASESHVNCALLGGSHEGQAGLGLGLAAPSSQPSPDTHPTSRSLVQRVADQNPGASVRDPEKALNKGAAWCLCCGVFLPPSLCTVLLLSPWPLSTALPSPSPDPGAGANDALQGLAVHTRRKYFPSKFLFGLWKWRRWLRQLWPLPSSEKSPVKAS